jgi:hypothetical protein
MAFVAVGVIFVVGSAEGILPRLVVGIDFGSVQRCC